ncbi:MAG TPA: MFS transporter [Blastocatellia bacterium]|nr:MFS transporter [Blastocatellia bacterium]
MPPTTARRNVLWLIFFLAVITYFDRLCISAAAPAITKEFGFTASQMGWIFSAFTFAYAIFEIPSGWLGDWIGTRKALTRIVVCWTIFTMLTGAAMGFWSLLAIRFLFGAGEAGAFPNIARTVSRWFPIGEQGRGISVAFFGLAVGSAISVPIVFPLVERFGWRWTFVLVGLVGFVWCAVWYWWFRDEPHDHPAVNAAELELIQANKDGLVATSHRVPWRLIFTSRNLLAIGAMYFAFGYGIFFYVTWLPTYLIKSRGFSNEYAKWFSALPWVVSGLAFLFGGWLTDRLAERDLKLARRGVGMIGYAVSGLALIAVAMTPNRIVAALLLAVAACFQMMTLSAAWSVCLDVGRKNAGVVTGFMNMIGNFGGTLSPIVVGQAVDRLQSWTLPFYIAAGVFAFSAVMWLFVDPYESVVTERE